MFYAASTCAIKDDVPALAACWVSCRPGAAVNLAVLLSTWMPHFCRNPPTGAMTSACRALLLLLLTLLAAAHIQRSGNGPLTRQEAGLLLWHHCACGGGDAVLATNAVSTCLDVLSASSNVTASPADKSTAAGLLHALCCRHGGDTEPASSQGAEHIARSKASGPGGASCCLVLHGCLADPDSVPRHVVALLAGLASCPVGVNALLKATWAAGGGVPWRAYGALLAASHRSGQPLDHTTAVDACTLIQRLVTGVRVPHTCCAC